MANEQGNGSKRADPPRTLPPQPAVTNEGKFQPIVKLGQGGMADVYLALANGPAGFNKVLVLKLLREDLSEEPEILQMFLDEARLAAQLEHENLVHTFETGQFEERYFISMEYLQGQSLSRVRRRIPDLSRDLRLWIVTQTLAGLHYAHELKGHDGKPLEIVHRDISPTNVMVTYDGRVKLLDFGIAKATSAENMTRVGVFKGKMGYCAPEQLRNGVIDRRADVFAAGVTLWELLVGRRLLGTDDMNLSLQLRAEGKEDLRTGTDHVPDPLLRVCERAMANDPAERFSSAEEMAHAIDAYLTPTTYRDAPRQLAKLVAEAFQEERAKLQNSIEEYLRDAVAARRAGVVRSSVPEMLPEWGTMTRQLTSLPPPLPEAIPAESLRARRLWGVAAMSTIALAGASAGWVMGYQKPAATAVAAAAPSVVPASSAPVAVAAAAPAPAAPAPVERVELFVDTDPPTAKLFLDGAPLTENPLRTTVEKDATVRSITASAPGYVTAERRVAMLESTRVRLVLTRITWQAPARAKAKAKAKPAAEENPPSADPRGATRRSLDTRDPWE